MSRSSGHKILDYNAKDDIVVCICGFEGTADGFDCHKTKGSRGSYGTLNFLKELYKARSEYPKQGSLTGTGRSYNR